MWQEGEERQYKFESSAGNEEGCHGTAEPVAWWPGEGRVQGLRPRGWREQEREV